MADRQDERAQKRRTTLSDVAARAGVSQVTASRVLRRPEMVSPALRKRVETAMRDLAYVPNQLASALASSRTGTVGVIVPSLTNGVFSDYLRALHDTFQPAGMQVLVLNSRYSPEEEERAITTLLGQHPEAMIVAGIDQTTRGRLLLEQAGVPVIQTMELGDDPIDINIGLSQLDAGHAATRFLLNLGHRRVGHISARLDARSRRRIEGYKQAMDEAGIDYRPMIATTPRPSTVALGAELFGAVLAMSPDVEALFCCNDDLALGAVFECHRRGIRVPEDLSIIGFNDLEFCASAFPSISSVAVPRYDIAARAAGIVLDIVRGSGERPRNRRIDVGFKVIERDSTRRRVPAGVGLDSLREVS
jgi:LacI family transcriptional regulator, gluconate utilization system Gnt-I transcriptional repressor